ncbi:unnamed protein product [Urochloa humidicola]
MPESSTHLSTMDPPAVAPSNTTPFPAAAAAAAEEEASTRRVANRIIRALQHQLRLLHRAGAEFFVLGATGNVYTVTLSASPACTCPDPAAPCKHILFVLLRVLGLSLDEACVWRHTLRPCQVARLVGTPTFPGARAGARAREKFHQLWSARPAAAVGQREAAAAAAPARPLDGAACPVCLEDMAPAAQQQAVLTCRTCRNAVHAECFARWKRSRARRAATCVVCRSRWRQPNRREQEEKEQYMNLAAYMNDDRDGDGDVTMQSADGGLCGG